MAKGPEHTPSKVEKKEQPFYLYISRAFIILLLAVGLFLFKKSASTTKKKKPSSNIPKNKSQMYDSAHSNIEKYHTELLKYIDIAAYRGNKKKMQIYYMFLAGVIDYFCQLEKFSDSEQRRVFSTHMTKQEGKDNITGIKQALLAGQREHSP